MSCFASVSHFAKGYYNDQYFFVSLARILDTLLEYTNLMEKSSVHKARITDPGQICTIIRKQKTK